MENTMLFDGMPLLYFLEISAIFVITMLTYFSSKNRKSSQDRKLMWLHRFFLGGFILFWISAMVFPKPLEARIFITLMLVTIITVETVINRRDKIAALEVVSDKPKAA